MSNYFDLGKYTRPITTSSPEAQAWFDRGMVWCYGFNHEEAIRCFRKVLDFDADCPMAYWGMAYARGPYYNKPWDFFGQDELKEALAFCYATTQEALARLDKASPVEQALILALRQRYQSHQVVSDEGFQAWTDDYAAAMKAVYSAFADDLDISTLYVEAMINRTPWKLWDVNLAQPAEGADTVEAMRVLEEAMRQVEQSESASHPGILHLYIHVMEMSPYPERALRACDQLRDLVPSVAHLRHMPSHIDVLCGHYYNAVVASDKAIMADNTYIENAEPLKFYRLSRCHNYHLKMYAAMFLGQYQPAIDAANGIIAALPDKVLRVDSTHLANSLEAYYSMKMHVLVRFGKWQQIIDAPLPADPQLYCVTTVMQHYAKGVAYAATGNIEAAAAEKKRFEDAYAKVPQSRRFFNNCALDVLAIGRAMLNGELEYRKENYEQAFAHLRQAVELDDNLYYTEPWAWMHPPRHALAALLLEQSHIAEAEEIYRADLGLDDTLNRPSQHPENVWSLHGYVECLERQGKHEAAAAMQQRLNLALARTDVEINASCCCRQHSCCG